MTGLDGVVLLGDWCTEERCKTIGLSGTHDPFTADDSVL